MYSKLDQVAALARRGKFQRLINNPVNYIFAIAHREILYRITQQPYRATADLFWGEDLIVELPSGIDMYILGAKADDSEIRLTKYLINNLKPGNQFIDIGAHFGYYAKLAAHLMGPTGNVLAIEPSAVAFELIKINTANCKNITTSNNLIGSSSQLVSFYELPTEYAEYNSINIDQYKSAKWFDPKLVSQSKKQMVPLDDLISDSAQKIDFIKIDVEGAEYEVLVGARSTIATDRPTISMEFINAKRSNSAHQAAVKLLSTMNYRPYIIQDTGKLAHVEDIDSSLNQRNIQSDNIIFVHDVSKQP